MEKSHERWLAIDIGVRNLSYCVLDDSKIYDWQHVDLLLRYTPYKSFKQMKLMHISALCDYLCQDLFQSIQVHHVIIEQQPFGSRGGSQKLGLLSHLLFEYFKTRRSRIGWPTSICIQPAQSKYCKAWLSEFKYGKQRIYNQRKQLSILLCKALLKTRLYKACLRPGAKRDDYADSFLLGRYAIEFKPRLGSLAHPIDPKMDLMKAQEQKEPQVQAQEQKEPQEQGQVQDELQEQEQVQEQEREKEMQGGMGVTDSLAVVQVSSRAVNEHPVQSCLLMTIGDPVAPMLEVEMGSPPP